ncbi:hypothetical protein [Sphingomonas sp. ID0503]|uniref:hypothetical protein n=1 Tax=Sphingomonas sp. ID0503 TaxID=3399691 RepID=UPI003AFAA578
MAPRKTPDPKTSRKAPARKPAPRATPAKDSGGSKWAVGAAAAGIGSAALVAALLYARKARRQEPAPKPPVDSED